MTATLRTFLASSILGGLVFVWWLPAHELADISELHLGQQHVHAVSPRGVIGSGLARFYGGTALRKPDTPYLPLALFIQSRFPSDVPQLTSAEWQAMIAGQTGSSPSKGWVDDFVLRHFWLPPELLPQAVERDAMMVQSEDDWQFYSLHIWDANELWGRGVPAEIHFPWRSVPLTLAGVAVVVLLLWMEAPGNFLETTSVAAARRLAIVASVWVGLLLSYVGSGALDNMDVGYAVILVGSVLLLTALASVVWLTLQLWRLARLMEGRGLLAEWPLDTERWRRYININRARLLGDNLMRLRVVTLVMSLVTLGLWLIVPDRSTALMSSLVLTAVLGLCVLVAFLTPWWAACCSPDAPPRVWIGEQGALVGNRYLRWVGLGSQPEAFRMAITTPGYETMEVVMQQTQLVVTQQTPVFFSREHRWLIPVPTDRLEESQQVMEKLRQQFQCE